MHVKLLISSHNKKKEISFQEQSLRTIQTNPPTTWPATPTRWVVGVSSLTSWPAVCPREPAGAGAEREGGGRYSASAPTPASSCPGSWLQTILQRERRKGKNGGKMKKAMCHYAAN